MAEQDERATDGDAWGAADAFLGTVFGGSDPTIEAAIAASEAAGLPSIHTSPLQGQLLGVLARSVRAARILEIGTLGGHGTIHLARALRANGDGATLLSVELDPDRADLARRNVDAAGLSSIVTIECASGVDVAERLVAQSAAPFDLISIDVDRKINDALLPLAIALSQNGTLIVVGEKDLLRGTRTLARVVAAHPNLTATAVQSIGSEGFHGHVIVHVGGPAAP